VGSTIVVLQFNEFGHGSGVGNIFQPVAQLALWRYHRIRTVFEPDPNVPSDGPVALAPVEISGQAAGSSLLGFYKSYSTRAKT